MPRKTIFLSRKKCRVCKKLYQPVSSVSVMCSEVCRNINRRNSYSLRLDKMRKKRNKEVTEVKCKNCKKIFFPVPSNRKFCSRECSLEHRPPRRRISSAKYERHQFKNFTLQKNRSDNQNHVREDINKAVKNFLKKGGTIKKLESLPLPKIPTVGSRDWDWETTVGLGFSTLEELTEPEYNIENIIK